MGDNGNMHTDGKRKEALSGRTVTVELEIVIGTLALALAWATLWMWHFAGSLGPSDQLVTSPVVITKSLGTLLGVIFFWQAYKRWPQVAESVPVIIVLSLLSLVATLSFSFIAAFEQMNLEALIWAVYGFLNASIWLEAAIFLVRRTTFEAMTVLVISSLLGALCVIISTVLPLFASQTFAALLIPLSLAGFYLSQRLQSPQARVYFKAFSEKLPKRRVFADTLGTYPAFFWVVLVLGLIYGFCMVNSFAWLNQTSAAFATAAALLMPGFITLVTYFIIKRTVNLRTLSSVILLLTIIALLPTLFMPTNVMWVFALLSFIAFNLFDLSAIATQVEIGKTSETFGVAIIVFGRLVLFVGITLGLFLRFIINNASIDQLLQHSITATLIIIAIASFLSFASSNSGLETKASLPGNTPFKQAVSQVANKYGLTPREQDILSLIAKGYNARRIETEALISQNTAKSHLYHIYTKLDVHSQQEIIEMIDVAVKSIKLSRSG
jgi:DNA-binding CsgD family transcriptional regulator